VLRVTTPSHVGQISVDAQGPGRLVIKPDGSIVWEVAKPDEQGAR
jgi:hypothetical protein